MAVHVSLKDRATVKESGYVIRADYGGFVLENVEDPGYLMIGKHGHVSPTEWEAFAEALARIRQDAFLAGDNDYTVFTTRTPEVAQ